MKGDVLRGAGCMALHRGRNSIGYVLTGVGESERWLREGPQGSENAAGGPS